MNRKPRVIATYRGDEFEAAIYLGDDVQRVALRSDVPVDGFAPDGERFINEVDLVDCEALHAVRSVGRYRELPVAVIDELGDQLQVESLANNAPAASAAGLERVERGVYRSWVPASDVQQQRLEYVDLNAAESAPQ